MTPSCTRLFSGGFRPFFLFGSLHAALMIALWVPWFLGLFDLPSALDPVVWHQHELLFGYVPAMVAGFLLTAVPNWTGRPALSGPPLVALFVLWVAGRLAIALSSQIGLVPAAIVTLAFLPVLLVLTVRELAAAKNKRNYMIAAILSLLFIAQLLFFYEFVQLGRIEMSGRLAIAMILLLIGIIGGRIIPTFTGNWLRQNNPGRDVPSFGRFDIIAMLVSLAALILWILSARLNGFSRFAGLFCLVAGALQLARQLRWQPLRTVREPLVLILHVAFFFLPLGFVLTGVGLLSDDAGLATAGLHAWTAGAIGATTLAVMTRATRGHSGQPLHAPASTVSLIYIPIVLAALSRITAAIMPAQATLLLSIAAAAWVLAFLGFAVFYAPFILRRS